MKFIKAIAAIAALTAAVSSYAVVPANLVVGFKQLGATNDLVLNLGTAASFTSSYSINLNSQLSSAGLSLGSAINWAAIAYTTSGANVNAEYVTSTWNTATAGTLGVQNSASYAYTTSNLNGTKAPIGSMDPLVTAAVGSTNTIAASNLNSFSTLTPGPSWNLFNNPHYMTSSLSLASGAAYSAADLLKATNGASTEIGTFSFYTADANGHLAGDLVFTVIPEPSTYAVILGALTIGFVALRRRFSKAV